MTINNSYTPVLVDGDGVTVDIDFDFKVYSTSELVVIVRDKTTLAETTLTLGVGFTAVLSEVDEGGTVTLTTAATSDEEVFIGSNISDDQTASFPLGQALREDNIELGLDKLTRLVQQNKADSDSAVKFALQQEAPNLPALSSGKFLSNDGTSLNWATPTAVSYAGTISFGTQANLPASPSVGDIYFTTDTGRKYFCASTGVWDFDEAFDSVTAQDITLTSGATVTAIRDEDDMVSDSATSLATQQSIKKYVDDSVKSFGTAEARSDATVYLAATDGLFVAQLSCDNNSSINAIAQVATDIGFSSPVLITGGGSFYASATTTLTAGVKRGGFCCPVLAGQYYKGTKGDEAGTASVTYKWFPLS